MKLELRGRYTVLLIDRRTRRLRRRLQSRNAITDAGKQQFATGIADQTFTLTPNRNTLQGAILRASNTPAFTTSGGPMRAQVNVDDQGRVTNDPGTPIYHNPPTDGVPIRLRWYDARDTTYPIVGARMLNGSTVLSQASFSDVADKRASDIMVLEFTLEIAGSGKYAAGAVGNLLARRLAGRANGQFSASITRADGSSPLAVTIADSDITRDGTNVTVRVSHSLASSSNVARRDGFRLNIGGTPVVEYEWAAGDEVIPLTGLVRWDVTFTVGTAAAGFIAVSAMPTAVALTNDINSADVLVTASGGSGSWNTPTVESSDGRISASVLSGTGPTWEVQISTSANAAVRATVTVTVSRGSGANRQTGTVSIAVDKESA